jgi:hypothetical protein
MAKKFKPIRNLKTDDETSSPPKTKAGSPKSGRRSLGKAAKPKSDPNHGTRKTKSARSGATAESASTDEEIRVRAYFISERRRRLDLAGDATSDWMEAKRQLLSEIGPG